MRGGRQSRGATVRNGYLRLVSKRQFEPHGM